MSWWNRISKSWLQVLVACLLLAFFLVFEVFLLQPRDRTLPGGACTMVDCFEANSALSIKLRGLPKSTLYQINVVFASGKKYTLTCEMGKNSMPCSSGICDPAPSTNYCTEDGVFLGLDKDMPNMPSPGAITVDVTWNGTKISRVFDPQYEKFQPNGEGCSPTCYSADVMMNVAQ